MMTVMNPKPTRAEENCRWIRNQPCLAWLVALSDCFGQLVGLIGGITGLIGGIAGIIALIRG